MTASTPTALAAVRQIKLALAALGMSALFSGAALASEPATAPVKTQHVQAQLFSETSGAAPGSTFYVGLRQEIAAGWHTYWRNPGDAGQATSISWTLPKGYSAGDIVWPTPERYVSGPLMNYVYSKEVYLSTPIMVPATAKPGESVTFKAVVDWLVCKDVCVPESAALTLTLPVEAEPKALGGPGAAVASAVQKAPKPAGLKASFEAASGVVRLSIVGAAVKGADVSHAYFYPFNGAVLEHAKAQKAARGPDGVTLSLPAGYNFVHNKPPAVLDGVIDLGGDKAFEVSAAPGPPLKGADGLSAAAATVPEGAPPGGGGGETLGLPAALLFAVLGGVVLNLMPCVFPVLSMKAVALARHVQEPARARNEALAYLSGTVLTFVALAGFLLAARAAGQAAGWGFQLQSPLTVAVLALVMLVVALNLSGVFEAGLSVQGAGQDLASRGGLLGAFVTGALAVVVAAPCTGPFMASAIGWAVLQPAPYALLVFAALGFGLALPFVVIAFVPAVSRLMPRPGAWMERLRQILAFPMYGAAAWLAWVFVQETSPDALPFLFAAAVVLSFAAYLWGLSQRSGGRALISKGLSVIALAASVPLCLAGASSAAPGGGASQGSSTVGSLAVEPWTPQAVERLQAAGRPVFVDFTAAWCVTCQVNERTALASPQVTQAFKKSNAAYLKADWTNRNPEIARALSASGRSGVPLYLLYDAKGSKAPVILPQLLTAGAVAEAIEAAAKPG